MDNIKNLNTTAINFIHNNIVGMANLGEGLKVPKYLCLIVLSQKQVFTQIMGKTLNMVNL